ncbi:acetate kinase 2 [Firmicutes bacterium CAG:582]|nr:acetate kinase 2 [Firmicutes bacterium CAG:582]
MKILTINAGSSSMKFSVIELPEAKELISGYFQRIGIDNSFYDVKINGEKLHRDMDLPNHLVALEAIKKEIVELGVVSSLDEIDGIGHRLVHGGEKYKSSVLIDDEVITTCKKFEKLAKLHMPAMLSCIEASKQAFPNTPMVAVFDTSFHQTMEPKNYLYAVPMDWYKNYGVRKYGFHGTSHRFINKSISEYLNRSDLKVISCHIGSGASLCAIDSGRVVDTSMGFSPMTGIMMGTRPGDVDPSVVQYMMDEAGMTIDEVMTALNKKSGLEGICGKSDSRDVEDGIKAGDEACILAQDMYTQKVANYIAMYNNLLNGADVIVFTAGLGENSIQTRIDVMDKIKSLGVKIDLEKNNFRGKFGIISADDSTIPVYVIPTNEELMIAMDTYEIVK